MQRYAGRLLLAVLLIGLCSFLLSRKMLQAARYYEANIRKMDFLLDSTDSFDLIYLGSSRMLNTVNPYYVDSILGIKSYNLGLAGSNIIEQEVLCNLYLKTHGVPRMAIVNLDMFSLHDDRILRHNLYLLQNAGIPEIGRLYEREGVAAWKFPFMPYLEMMEFNDLYRTFLINKWFGKPSVASGAFYYSGYESNTNVVMQPSTAAPMKTYTELIDSTSVHTLRRMLATFRKKGIEVVFTYAPEYRQLHQKRAVNAVEIFGALHHFANRYNIPFWRNDSLAMCQDSMFFANPGHVNILGAAVYSRILGAQLAATGYFEKEKLAVPDLQKGVDQK